MQKIVGILFGGKSAEHEISILSSRNVVKNLDRNKYIPFLIYIDKNGNWLESSEEELNTGNFSNKHVLMLKLESNEFKFISSEGKSIKVAAIFPVLHGPNGEDGSVQGFFEIAEIPYIGPGIAGSSIAMDKEITKRLLNKAGIGIAKYITLLKWERYNKTAIIRELGLPLVIKPSRAGSSVGISKVKTIEELDAAIDLAFQFDYKILAEEYIKGREIEVAVLGNEEVIASIPGEIVSEFYDYKEKYSSESKTHLDAPALLEKGEIKKLQDIAIKTFKVLECEGMSRVDFFYTPERILINEVNTIPGFTNISMYPKLFELSGIPQKELITKLIELGIERQERKNKLKSSLN